MATSNVMKEKLSPIDETEENLHGAWESIPLKIIELDDDNVAISNDTWNGSETSMGNSSMKSVNILSHNEIHSKVSTDSDAMS